ncbi:hypothetical protein AGABI1DRAFT_63880, partial [Agaricus bisporus var. burnettii JB137-S8]
MSNDKELQGIACSRMASPRTSSIKGVWQQLSWLDRLLSPLILLAMILGTILSEFTPQVRQALNVAHFNGVSVPIVIGLVVMMWPVLTKVQYEKLPALFSSSKIWVQIGISVALNWIVGPFVMLGLAWATLPDLPTYRTGVIMVGIARCIAMVMIWNTIAKGHVEYCAILVVFNAVLQIALYSPYAVWFINVIGRQDGGIKISYGDVAISVLIYLGIPLVAGVVTRYSIWLIAGKRFLVETFVPYFSPVALLGLLYTIIVLFAYQGHEMLHHIGPVFRVFVPLVLYFVVMWSSAFALMYYLNQKERKKGSEAFDYEIAVSQAFTAASNNFELAIAVAIAVYGVDSQQALAATVGPLVEVPVLLALTWVALLCKDRLGWQRLN